MTSDRSDSFETMVPGLAEARERRMKEEHPDLEDDESVSFGEE